MIKNYFNKKSISPLIATVLIIVVAVALIAGVVSWSKDFTHKSLDETTNVITYDKSDLEGFIKSESVYESTSKENSSIILENLNSYKDLNIVSYKMIDDDVTNDFFIDREFTLSSPVIVSKKSGRNQLPIMCIPSNIFELELITSEGEYVTVPVSAQGTSLESCSNLVFSSTWDTTKTGSSDSNQITLPLVSSGSYDFLVDWGDGTTSQITIYNDSDLPHTYSSSGIYVVKIYGIIKGWSFADSGDKFKLLNISNWGVLQLGNTNNQFKGCSNLTISATDILDLESTVSFQGLFFRCYSLKTVPNINLWDVSNITDLSTAFGLSAFNDNISSWDVSNVTNFMSVFWSNSSFNQDISDWDVSSMTTGLKMFNSATSFNQNLADWEVPSGVGVEYIFTSANMSTTNCDAIKSTWGFCPDGCNCSLE